MDTFWKGFYFGGFFGLAFFSSFYYFAKGSFGMLFDELFHSQILMLLLFLCVLICAALGSFISETVCHKSEINLDLQKKIKEQKKILELKTK